VINRVHFHAGVEADYKQWETDNPKVFARIDRLISDIIEHPFTGLGKPEPLKHGRAGQWSRRITHEHRLVYYIEGDILRITACKGHY
jgi:toxin YoeB